MKSLVRKCFANGLCIAGAIVGVGLASGREIVSFFAKYGFCSIALCFLSAISIFVISFMIFECEQKNMHINSLKYAKNKKRKFEVDEDKNANVCNKISASNRVSIIFNYIMFLCQLAFCSAMFAGMKSILSMLRINAYLNVILLVIIALVVFFIVLKSKNAVFSINILLSVLLIAVVFLMFVKKIMFGEFNILLNTKFKSYSVLMPILYAGMNMLTAYPLLCETSHYLENKKQRLLASFFVSLIVFIILIIICFFVLLFGGGYISSDMIMIEIVGENSIVLKIIYTIIMAICVFTTLVSTVFGMHKYMPGAKRPYKLFLCIAICFALSFVGFSNIVDFVYPFLGVLCVMFVSVRFSIYCFGNK